MVGSLRLCLSLPIERYSLSAGVKWLSICMVQTDSFLMLLMAACSISRQGLLFLAQNSYSRGREDIFSWLLGK